MKIRLVLVLLFVTVFSCSDDDYSSAKEIVDEWKLIETRHFSPEGITTTDYSTQNVVYDFREDGTLKVTGSENGVHPNGDYDYVLEEGYEEGNSNLVILTVIINQLNWTYDLTNRKLTLGLSHIDLPDLVFERK